MSQDKYTRITLRIPKDIQESLRAAADNRSHSMNAEIIDRLQHSLLEKSPVAELERRVSAIEERLSQP